MWVNDNKCLRMDINECVRYERVYVSVHEPWVYMYECVCVEEICKSGEANEWSVTAGEKILAFLWDVEGRCPHSGNSRSHPSEVHQPSASTSIGPKGPLASGSLVTHTPEGQGKVRRQWSPSCGLVFPSESRRLEFTAYLCPGLLS